MGPLNLNVGIHVSEIPDTIPPKLISASVDLGLNLLFIHMSETIDVTPSTNVDTSKLSVINASETLAFNGSRLAGAFVVGDDSVNVTVRLTEVQRVNILYR